MTPKYQANSIFFTADTHFFHKAMLNWRKSFQTVEEMNETIIRNWNSVVKPTDHVFHLGDVTFGKPSPTIDLVYRLNGNVILVKGNHDKKLSPCLQDFFAQIHDYLEIDVIEAPAVKQRICMMHFPLRTWNRCHYGSWHLHGHSHGNISEPLGRSLDVGVDPNAMHLLSYEQVKDRVSSKPIHTIDHHTPRN